MDRDQALRLAVVVERRARTDAATWVDRLQQQAHLVARGRAEQVIEPQRATSDPLRTAVTREWYVRVFEDQVRQALGVAKSEIAVTSTETEHVAECLRDGVGYRIHGPGGSLVLNRDGPQQVPGQNGYMGRDEVESARPPRPEWWHREELERLAAAQDQRRAEDERIVAASWDQLSPDQRVAFAAYYHQHQGTSGPAAYPQVDTPSTQPVPVAYTAADTGNRNPIPGPPARVAAEVFGQQPVQGPAEVNAARTLVAQAFPRNVQKPPTITTTGQTRTSPGLTDKRADADRGR